LSLPEEQALWDIIQNESAASLEDVFLKNAEHWTSTLHQFFDQVRVMDPEFKEHRLALLGQVDAFFTKWGQLPLLLGAL
jgi:glycyl-tRNA synthetase beta subunit